MSQQTLNESLLFKKEGFKELNKNGSKLLNQGSF